MSRTSPLHGEACQFPTEVGPLWLYANDDMTGYIKMGHDPIVSELLRFNLRRGYTFLDVGAHVGLMSLQALTGRALGYFGQVVAVEADPDLYELLKLNLEQYPNARTVFGAASDEGGELVLHRSHRNSGENSALPAYVEHSGFTSHPVTVPAFRLDEVLADLEALDVVKIDVEAAEVSVVRGMEGLIEKFHPLIILEWSETHIEGTGQDPDELKDYYRSLGYRVEQIPGELVLVPRDVGSVPGWRR